MSRTGVARPVFVAVTIFVLAVALLAGGCGAKTVVTTTSSTTPAGIVGTTTTASIGGSTSTSIEVPPSTSTLLEKGDLILSSVQNAEIALAVGGSTLRFALVDGLYQSSSGSNPADLTVTMLDEVAFGDLDGDGADDAAAVISVLEGPGGASGGQEESEFLVAFISMDGEPVQAGYHLLESGMSIETLVLQDSEIVLQANVPGPEDASGESAVPIVATFGLRLDDPSDGILVLTSQTSETPEGETRKIVITSPQPDTGVIGVIVVKGTITIAPSENNLVYGLYDMGMIELTEGPVPVIASDLASPGTFEFAIYLDSLGCVGQVLLTVSDLSPVDGAVLALDSVSVDSLANT